MARLNISQLNMFFQVCAIIVLSSFILKLIDGQGDDWPIVSDPFPDSDQIGPEPIPTPPPTVDCTEACQGKIDEALNYITTLQTQLATANNTLMERILSLEETYYNALSVRVVNLENQLPGNVTTLNNKITDEVDKIRRQYSDEIATLRTELETKINNIPSSSGGGGNSQDVFLNLTLRIDSLENGKIQSLITDSNLWRQNFKVVNSTFAKLRKSTANNNVVITG